jgi:hypothetical protein
MNTQIQEDIIELTRKNVRKSGSFSIKEAAISLGYQNISLSEQKKLAKLIVKFNSFVTELKDGVIIVKQNKAYNPIEAGDTATRHRTLEYIIWGIVALLAYLVFDVFLPGLKN